MRRNQGTAKEWCVRRNPLGRRSWAYTEALTSGYMMADEVHSSKFHASRGGVLVACPELDWFSDPGTAVGQNIFPISPPDKVLIFLVGGLCCAFCSGVFSGQQRTQDLPVVTNKAITRSPPTH